MKKTIMDLACAAWAEGADRVLVDRYLEVLTITCDAPGQHITWTVAFEHVGVLVVDVDVRVKVREMRETIRRQAEEKRVLDALLGCGR